MGRLRRPIKGHTEGRQNVCRFRHPLTNRIVRFDLGPDHQWRKNLDSLNECFLNPALWRNPQSTMPNLIRDQWLGRADRPAIQGKHVRKGDKDIATDAKAVFQLQLDNNALRRRVDELLDRNALLIKKVEFLEGRKFNEGHCSLTLLAAKEKFMATFTGRSNDTTTAVQGVLDRFCDHFQPQSLVSKLEGQEMEINAWLRGLKRICKGSVAKPISGARLNFVRVYILKMLTAAGLVLNKKQIDLANKKRLRRERGPIRFTSRDEAGKIAAGLKGMWLESWQLQNAVAIRPSEIMTLHRNNFNADCSKCVLAPLGHLTLKTGSRVIPIPESIRPLIKWKIQNSKATDGVLFPDPRTGKPWRKPAQFYNMYLRRLRKVAAAVGITVTMDSRIGRRSCATALIEGNYSAEKVAALMGNSAAVVLEHYGDADVTKLDLDKNVVGEVSASASVAS
jgi:integrase